jgi:Na+-driven multidrug efflux pump
VFSKVLSLFSKLVAETGKLLKLIALVHLLDGTQGMFCGILKAVGAQLYSSITMFVSFYIIGSIVSLGLLFNTYLEVYGRTKLYLLFRSCSYI